VWGRGKLHVALVGNHEERDSLEDVRVDSKSVSTLNTMKGLGLADFIRLREEALLDCCDNCHENLGFVTFEISFNWMSKCQRELWTSPQSFSEFRSFRRRRCAAAG
jgi:hypothetical protein